MSKSLYISLNSWWILTLHIPCSTACPYVLPNIFLSHVLSLFISIPVNAQVSLPHTITGSTTVTYIPTVTALLVALDLETCSSPSLYFFTCYTLSRVCKMAKNYSLRSHGKKLGSDSTEFHDKWYWSIFWKSVEKIQVSLQSDKNNGHCTWRSIYIFYRIISLSSSQNGKCFRQTLCRKSKHTFYAQ